MLQSQSPSPSATKWWAEVVPLATPATFEDLLHTPDDGSKYELVDGILLRMPPPQEEHSNAQVNIIAKLKQWSQQYTRGRVRAEIGLLLDVGGKKPIILGPDACYIAPGRQGARKDAYERIAPDLVVEIVSPSQKRSELVEKVRLYLAAGVQLVWLVWPNPELVEVWQADETALTRARNRETLPSVVFTSNATLAGFAVLPNFTCPVADFFEE